MIIHTAWVGPDPIPESFNVNMHTQKRHARFVGPSQHSPGFEWRCWTPELIARYPFLREVALSDYWRTCMEAKHYAAACDYLRLVLLWNFGGLWCDGDVEIVKDPERLFMQAREDFLKAAAEDGELLGTAVIYAPPRHQVIGKLIDEYKIATYADVCEGGGLENGPARFTRVAKANPDRVCLLSSEFFYPSSWRTPDQVNITENTIAWHKWAGSWKATADLSKWRYK